MREKKITSGNSKLKNHYENICNKYFNSFELTDFTCAKDKILVTAKNAEGENKQEFQLKNGLPIKMVLSPGQNTETQVTFDDKGITDIKSPVFRKNHTENFAYTRNFTTIQGQREAAQIQKQDDFWLPRYVLYIDSVTSCCQQVGAEQTRCKKDVLSHFAKDGTLPSVSGRAVR